MKKTKRDRQDFRVFVSRKMVKVPLDLIEKIVNNTQKYTNVYGGMGEIVELPYLSTIKFCRADLRGLKIRIARARKGGK